MIISDTYQFAFVHIPKCAGTSVRALLERYNEAPDAHTLDLAPHPTHENIVELPDLGFVDFHHLPLQALSAKFPEQIDKLRRYEAVTIAREPHDRLVSAFAEHMKRYRDTPLQNLSMDEVEHWLVKILAEVSAAFAQSPLLPYEFIHFQPQIDYIELNGERVIGNVFPISDMSGFEAKVREQFQLFGETPEGFGVGTSNVSLVHRSEILRRLIEFNRPIIRVIGRLVPQQKRAAWRELVYVTRQSRFASLATSEPVREFVRRHMSTDVKLWDEIRESNGR